MRPLALDRMVAVVFVGAVVSACSLGLSSGSSASTAGPTTDGDGGAGDKGSYMADGGAAASSAVSDAATSVANPLCGVTTAAVCTPGGATIKGASIECGSSGVVGAGIADADGGGAGDGAASPVQADGNDSASREACYVGVDDGGAPAPTCESAGTAGDGEACSTSTDCAAGFDCVRATGRCRAYCCDGACSGAGRFCALLPQTDAPHALVPVCAATTPCGLLGSDCSASETCSVVLDDGTTSCVAAGTAKEGDSCEASNCEAGDVCLGQQGNRRCYKLCSVSNPNGVYECPSGKTCRGSAPLFRDATVGVCQ